MDKERSKIGKQIEFERSRTISELQKPIDAGFNSGPEVSFDPEAFKRNMLETRN